MFSLFGAFSPALRFCSRRVDTQNLPLHVRLVHVMIVAALGRLG